MTSTKGDHPPSPVVLNPTNLQDTHKASTFVLVTTAPTYLVECEKPVRLIHTECEAHVGAAHITFPNLTI